MALDLRESRGDGPPLVLQPTGRASLSDLLDMLSHRRAAIEERLLGAGAILFRGFPVDGADAFAAASRAFGARALAYTGGDSPRVEVMKHVYTSTECPPSVRIPLHNEMSYLPRYPRQLWFFCARAAMLGGATPLADARRVLATLRSEVRRRFETRGVRYECAYPPPRGNLLSRIATSWRDAFHSDDPSTVEERCRALALDPRWSLAGHLVTRIVRPALARHPITGEDVWFNQAHLFRLTARAIGHANFTLAELLARLFGRTHHATYGDGGEIEATTLEAVLDAIEAHTRAVPWRAGDLLLVDNLLCMHGRQAFVGKRKVLVTMSE
jgi:alpha-ketoglutarate-dependent taurine dioxygenase